MGETPLPGPATATGWNWTFFPGIGPHRPEVLDGGWVEGMGGSHAGVL